jgi:hypothetical protein
VGAYSFNEWIDVLAWKATNTFINYTWIFIKIFNTSILSEEDPFFGQLNKATKLDILLLYLAFSSNTLKSPSDDKKKSHCQ